MYGRVALECMGVIQCNVCGGNVGMYGKVTLEGPSNG